MLVRRHALAVIIVLATIVPAAAQTVIDVDALQDLPVTDNLFSVLDTIEAPVISDRFSPGGLSQAEAARVGAFLSSWTQSAFRIGDVDITSVDSGTPLLAPPLLFWERVSVATGGMPPDASAPGLLTSLEPRLPSDAWRGSVRLSGSPAAFATLRGGAAPAIALPDGWMQTGATASGPLVRDRLGAFVAATWSRSAQFDRGNPAAYDASIASVFGHLVFTPGRQSEVRTIAWIQGARYPSAGRIPYAQAGSSDHDTGAHFQTAWERHEAQHTAWRIFGAFTTRARNAAVATAGAATIERLIDGPVPALVDAAGGTERRWTLGARINPDGSPSAATRRLQAGVDIGGAGADVVPSYPPTIRELVDGLPARAWRYSAPRRAHRSETTVAAFVADRFTPARRMTLDAALRFDGVTGAARGAAQGVAWRTWLPRAAARWTIVDALKLDVLSIYSRTSDRLMLGTLAYGDPASAAGDVFRWNGGENLGPLVARVGPGTGVAGTLTTIDAHVARPITDELQIGIEAQPLRSLQFRLVEILKRESHALAVLNVGVPLSSYAVSGIPDTGGNLFDPRDDQLLPVYDRLPGSFGNDRYLLTNSPADAATFGGLALSAKVSTPRMLLFAGGTTSDPHVAAGNRGFHANENDIGILGELFTNPNATTHAGGFPFTDRSYTVKLAGAYRIGRGVKVGVIARYQDGQPFARMIVVPGLNQGAEAIRAILNGLSRFTYTGTLDVRVQKEFTRGARRIAVVVDVYNLPNMRKEVEEHVVMGPHFRDETAVQPPRTVVIGLRFNPI